MIYGTGKPTSSTPTNDDYLDLETDTMYEFYDGEWVVRYVNGVEVELDTIRS